MSNPCTDNPDVAGAGDIVSFIVINLVTTGAALFAASRIYRRRPRPPSTFYDTLLTGFSLTQLVYGSAILFALWAQRHHRFTLSVIEDDPYYHLIVYMMLANMSSGFACTLSLELNGAAFKGKVRAGSYVIVTILYFVLLIQGADHQSTGEFCSSLILTTIGGACAISMVIAWWTKSKTPWAEKMLKPLISLSLVTQCFSVLWGVVHAILLRWFNYEKPVQGCLLDSPSNNVLDFGQVFAIVLTCIIPLTVLDALFDDINDEVVKPKLQFFGCYDWLEKKRKEARGERRASETHGDVEFRNYAIQHTIC